MSINLKRAVKRNILDYKAYIRKQNIRELAASRYSPTTVLRNRQQAQNLVEKVNTKLNTVFDDLNVKARKTAEDIIDDPALMRRFVQSDKFNLTFSQKFQMSRKRIRKLIKNSIMDSFDKGLSVRETLNEAQRVWESTAEFIKFIAYMVADAYNFAEMNRIEEHSTTGFFEIYLSELHEHFDICNHRVGIYEVGAKVDLPPYHPYCVCGVRAVDDRERITAAQDSGNIKTGREKFKIPKEIKTKKGQDKYKKEREAQFAQFLEKPKTREELIAETQAIENEYNAKYPNIQFKLFGAHPVGMRSSLTQFDKLAKEFPTIAEKFEEIVVEPEEAHDGDWLAYATRNGKKISFNSAFWGDIQLVVASKKRSYSSNWTVQTADADTSTTLTHEFGHHLRFHAESLDSIILLTKYARASNDYGTYGHIRKVFNETHPHWMAERVSNYATTDMDEAAAESFSASYYRNSSSKVIKERRTRYDVETEKFLKESAKLTAADKGYYEEIRNIRDQTEREAAAEALREETIKVYERFGVRIRWSKEDPNQMEAFYGNTWFKMDVNGNLTELAGDPIEDEVNPYIKK